MREILFCGKRIDNGEWVEGYFVGANYPDYKTLIIGDMSVDTDGSANISDILSWQIYEVDPETVSEFTGRRDKNGKRIFEGHIVRILYTDWMSKPDSDARTLEQYLHDIAEIGTVVWNRQDCCFYVRIKDYLCPIEPGKYGYVEVIGNKWDNPELLEG